MSGAYYNEFDPYAAQWLRNLIKAGLIAPGDVDERSILHVRPNDLRGYDQCHFFAGIGVWSLGLRLARWPDQKHIWTASCPCQPFSGAGEGKGFADERHLWPAFYHLVSECGPSKLVGEQVAASRADIWIDLIQDDLEALDYAFGAVPFPSASVGAPHLRDRTYWLADADFEGLEGRGRVPQRGDERLTGPGGLAGRLAHSADLGRFGGWSGLEGARGEASWLELERLRHADQGGLPGPTNSFWRDADWLGCTDGKWRPVESGTFPLATGAASRVGRIRAYGNAVNAQQVKVFIENVAGACDNSLGGRIQNSTIRLIAALAP